jgi:hypothetical protein
MRGSLSLVLLFAFLFLTIFDFNLRAFAHRPFVRGAADGVRGGRLARGLNVAHAAALRLVARSDSLIPIPLLRVE